MTDKIELTRDSLPQVALTESGHFGYTPIPSEVGAPFESRSDSSTSSPKDAYGLVLLLSSVEPVWQLNSLFCYRALWHDDRENALSSDQSSSNQEVILTVATGNLM